MTFWIILKLVLIGLALFSYLSYKSRRSDNHGALAQLRQAPVLRTLTPDEALALEPLRILDLCCGSGCIGIVAAHAFEDAELAGHGHAASDGVEHL